MLGQSFTAGRRSAAVSGADEAELEPRLRALVRRELLTLEADPRSPERGQYAFVQALIREVAYNTLARADRKSRHLAAARCFEALGEDELAGALAATTWPRTERAGRRRGRRPGRPGADRAQGCGGTGRSLGSHDQALAFLRQALEITTDERRRGPPRASGRRRRTPPTSTRPRLLEQAIAWYRARGDLRAVARATAQLGVVLDNVSQPNGAAKVMEAAPPRRLASRPTRRRPPAAELSRAYATRRPARARDRRPRARGGRAASSWCRHRRGPVQPGPRPGLWQPAVSEPVALLRGALVLAEANGLGSTWIRATNNLAATLENDDPREAMALSENGIEYARRIGNRPWLEFMASGMTSIDVYTGEWEKADRTIAEFEGRDLAVPVKVPLGHARAMRFQRLLGSDRCRRDTPRRARAGLPERRR